MSVALERSDARSGCTLAASNLGLYDQSRWVWRELNLELVSGVRSALVAPSGKGKTALLLSLAGLITPTEGEVSLDGVSFADWHAPSYRARVAYLPQRPVLSDAPTVEALIREPFSYRVHQQRQFPDRQLQQWLALLGRPDDFLQRRASTLSGGEQQITALLRCLALQPTLLLLDEPTASLDAATAEQLEALLADWLAADSTRGWLWVSHNEAQIARIADRVITL